MRKYRLVKNMHKLNFHLVPISGVAKRNGGDKKFRAEFVRGDCLLDFTEASRAAFSRI